ncbi:hypothetical protein [Sulfurimonas sp.]
MNKSVILGAILASLLTVTTASAAQNQFGLGVGATGDTATIRGTINLNKDMRLEPYFGYTYTDPKGASSQSNLDIGVAFHMVKKVNTKVRGYYGAFAGINDNDNGVVTNTIFTVGPVVGAEYFFDSHFTLGAEARMYLGFGDYSTLGTNSSVLLRYYF